MVTLQKAVGYDDDTSNTQIMQDWTDGSQHVTLGAAIAGERNADSASLGYLSVKEDWNYTLVDLVDNSTVVSATPAIIGTIWVNTVLSAQACPIKNGAVTVYSLPASAPVTTTEATSFKFLRGTRFDTSLIVDPDDAATGTIVVQWRPL
jgi:hypothetical protein